jgi:hypothetical protein
VNGGGSPFAVLRTVSGVGEGRPASSPAEVSSPRGPAPLVGPAKKRQDCGSSQENGLTPMLARSLTSSATGSPTTLK